MKNLISCFLVFILFSCNKKEAEVPFTSNICQGYPAFMKKLMPGAKGIAFSTTEGRNEGLWLVNPAIEPGKPGRLLYQDSSWKMAGWMGPLLTDKAGIIWCAPIPVVNMLKNPLEKQNNLYAVNPATGKMELFLALPPAEEFTSENPFGILGIAYNCEANTIYVSSVAGSTRKKQRGKIYCINIEKKKIQSTLHCGDAFGLGVSYKDGFRKLYFGSARNESVYAIGLDENGSFSGKPEFVFSLAGLGLRGDDKAKKIREDKNGNLVVTGQEFNFNLTAPTEKQETVYNFVFDFNTEKWRFSN
jgi:hypothetical protein